MQTLEQRRAKHALDRVKELEKQGQNAYGKYASYVSALPASILTNGLGQAAATQLSQQSDVGHKALYNDLQDWLCGIGEAAPFRNAAGGDTRLINAITSSDQAKYFRAQTEALAYLVWLKKFAKAFLDQGGQP
jgi:CRISPR-associated protein Cmr5